MTFERHLRSVSSAAAQRLGIMRKSWKEFHDRSLLLRSFWSFVLPVWKYCSPMWCSAADSHLKLLDRFVRSAGFLAGGVLEWNLSHRRSVAELCMLFKIKSNPMHPLSCALPLACCFGCSCRHSFAPPCCRTSQYRRTFVALSVSLWNDLNYHVFDGVELAGFKSTANAFLLAWSALSFLTLTILSFSSFHGLVVWSLDFELVEWSHSIPALHSWLHANDNNNNKIRSVIKDRILSRSNIYKTMPTNHIWSHKYEIYVGTDVNHMGTPHW